MSGSKIVRLQKREGPIGNPIFHGMLTPAGRDTRQSALVDLEACLNDLYAFFKRKLDTLLDEDLPVVTFHVVMTEDRNPQDKVVGPDMGESGLVVARGKLEPAN